MQSFTQTDLSPSRLLIIDDQQPSVIFLELLLKAAGFLHYQSTTEPRDFVSLYRRWQPDLILLDLQMPHLDGFAILDQLRSEFRLELHQGLAGIRTEMANMRADMFKWMLVFWIGQFAALVGALSFMLPGR